MVFVNTDVGLFLFILLHNEFLVGIQSASVVQAMRVDTATLKIEGIALSIRQDHASVALSDCV